MYVRPVFDTAALDIHNAGKSPIRRPKDKARTDEMKTELFGAKTQHPVESSRAALQ